MDIARDPKPKTRKRIIQWSVGALALIGITVGLRNLEPAVPSVDIATIWTDTVRHGTMVRQIRGPGTLVPEQMRWVVAETAGRVEQIVVLPGTEIEESTVIARMSNPDVDISLLHAQQALSSAETALISLSSSLENQQISQEVSLTSLRTQLRNARREHGTNQRLYDTNPELVAATELARTREAVEDFEERERLETRRLAVLVASVDEQFGYRPRLTARASRPGPYREGASRHRRRTLIPSPGDPTEPITRHLADKWLRKGEKLAGLAPLRGTLLRDVGNVWASHWVSSMPPYPYRFADNG